MLRTILTTLLLGVSAVAVNAQDWAKARLDKSPRKHEEVMVKGARGDIATFIAYPATKDKRPVVVLIHDRKGLTDWVKDLADEIAGMGYVTLAPSLLSGTALPADGQAMPDLDAVADYGLKLPASNGMLFAVGLGWGGEQSFRFAAARPTLAAALVFCGASPDNDSIAKIKGSAFGFYAANDPAVDATVAPARAAAKSAEVVFEAVTYKGVGPGFLEAGDAPNASATDKLNHGYAMERMKSVLDMVALRGY